MVSSALLLVYYISVLVAANVLTPLFSHDVVYVVFFNC
jgi:hypothetical protein